MVPACHAGARTEAASLVVFHTSAEAGALGTAPCRGLLEECTGSTVGDRWDSTRRLMDL